MRIAFTAPMKPIDDPVPSGDRTMGRLIVKALESAGHEVRIASRFRSWRKDGGDDILTAVRDAALEEAEQVAESWTREGYRPDLFLTYHLYHKAPDWIGPALADRFGLPYVIVEASRALKRKTGPWALGFQAADEALHRSDAVAAIHNWDRERLLPFFTDPKDPRPGVLLPFLDSRAFEEAAKTPRPPVQAPLKLLAVGMMREGDKTRSYEVLAEALGLVMDLPWQLTIIGDGPARDHVLALFPADRIRWLGALPPEQLAAQYAAHDLFVWPAIREAFGFVTLEAQAAGTGVICGDALGVPEIVQDGVTGLLAPEGDAMAFADRLRSVLDDPMKARAFGAAAAAHIAQDHSLEAGAARLDAFLKAAQDHYRCVRSKPKQDS